MKNEKKYIVPVYLKIKAESYEDAEIIANSVAQYGMQETAHNVPNSALKDWNMYIGDLQ